MVNTVKLPLDDHQFLGDKVVANRDVVVQKKAKCIKFVKILVSKWSPKGDWSCKRGSAQRKLYCTLNRPRKGFRFTRTFA